MDKNIFTQKYKDKEYLGIDIGSVGISLALVSNNKKVIKTKYCFHKGNIKKALKQGE